MSMNDRGLTFIRIAPYLLSGTLTITAWPSGSNPINVTAKAGTGYAFSPIPLNLTYSAAALFPCMVTVWKLSTGCTHAAFSRYPEEAIIDYDHVRIFDQICYFFEFSAPPFLEMDYRDAAQPPLRLIQMDGVRGYSRGDLEQGMSANVNTTFTIVVREYSPLDFRLRLWTDSTIVDWDDGESEFMDCRENPAHCTVSNFGQFNLEVARQMAPGLIAFMVSISILAILIAGFLVFWNSGPDISVGSGMKPLQSGFTPGIP
jgi:hypothetical protein